MKENLTMSLHHEPNWLCLVMGVLLLLCEAVDASGKSLFVSPLGNGQDGHSWETAYQTIQGAIDNSQSGDCIYVSNDSYGDRVLVMQNVNIHGGIVYGATGHLLSSRKEGSKYTTITFSGYPYTAFVCQKSCQIRGFRISPTNTSALSLYRTNITVEDCIIENGGTGIFVNEGSADLKNIIVNNNKVEGSRGGLYIVNGSTVNIEDCTISNNISYHSSGGGIYCSLSNLTMNKCIVINNRAVTISSDESRSVGGGVMIAGKGNFATIQNSIIANNWSTEWRQIAIGSSIEPYVNVENCTIIGDNDMDIYWETVPPIIINSIIWGNNRILSSEQGEADISFSCIQGGYTGTGNIGDDPKFRDAANGDYRLLPESPCIDTAGTSGPSDDLNGNPRPVDIAGIGREVTDTYDMGAYEVQLNEVPTPTPTQIPSQIDPGNTMLYR